jgi:RHS repeat-associated protein
MDMDEPEDAPMVRQARPEFIARIVSGDTSAYGWQYLFQGGRLDPVTVWYDFRNRDYIPAEGRWAQRDPMGLGAGDLNIYRYVENSPTNLTDPTGFGNKTVNTGIKGVEFFIEWFPEKNTGELKILTKKVETAIVKWVLDKKTGQFTCNIVATHAGKVLPGVAQSTLKKIMPKLIEEMDKNVARIGQTWVLTNLAKRDLTGGRVGLGRASTPAKPGGFGLGMLFGAISAFFSMENTCQAA